jgi:sRNA-binding regulator protein Hfq
VESSVIYSIGTALNRAKDHDLPVTVLVANDWVQGRVVAVDSHGLVLETDQQEHCVVRLQAVNAIRTGVRERAQTDRFAAVSVA